MKETAIIIFAFNRPEHLRSTLSHLSKCDSVLSIPVFFFIDGPRSDSERKVVDEVRLIAESFKHPQKQIISKTVNNGLKKSVISGISTVFESFDRAIILEDDICVNHEFLNYHLRCLEIYEEREEIWSVSGFVIPSIGNEAFKLTGDELVLAQRASSWGWSTWRTRWIKANWDSNYISKSLKMNYKKYGMTGGDKLRMILREMSGKSSSWAIIWDYNHFINSAYCVYPVKSLIKNIGLDNSGTHSKPLRAYEVRLDENVFIENFKTDIKPNDRIRKLFSRINSKPYRWILDKFKLLKFLLSQ